MPDAAEVLERLTATEDRVAGSDGERRAAVWLAGALRAEGLPARIESAWVRPRWAATHALHAALAVAGSIVSVSAPAVGLGILGFALLSLLLDLADRLQLVRRMTPRRATQNLTAATPADAPGAQTPKVHLIVTAPLDAPRAAAMRRPLWTGAIERLRRMLRGRLPAPLALLALAIAALTGIALARLLGAGGSALNVAQIAVSLVPLAAFAALVDAALATPSPGANASASAVAAALALTRTLQRIPPTHLDVQLVLAGAGDAAAQGLNAYIRRRREWRGRDVAVIAFEPCGAGRPRWWTHEGPLLALRLHHQLVQAAAATATAEPELQAAPHRGHGAGAAWRARRRGWPAIAIGCLEADDSAGHGGRADDSTERVDAAAIDAAVALALGTVLRLDAALQNTP